MSEYLDLIDSSIKDSQQKLEVDLKARAESMTEEEKLDFYDFYEDDMINLGSDFPVFLFSGFVISWYSFIEHELISLCKSLKLTINVSIQDKTRFEEGIRRAYNFLGKAANYKIDDKHWQELEAVRQVRNRLVHEGGRLIPKPDRTKPDMVEIDLDEDGSIYLPINQNLYQYLIKYNLYAAGCMRLAPNYVYCKHLVTFGMELLVKIYKDFNLLPIAS
ncbi:hypothetical protein [Stenomitos frigidus]|nr:hypothetical protein [Stenomitos frigidus]